MSYRKGILKCFEFRSYERNDFWLIAEAVEKINFIIAPVFQSFIQFTTVWMGNIHLTLNSRHFISSRSTSTHIHFT